MASYHCPAARRRSNFGVSAMAALTCVTLLMPFTAGAWSANGHSYGNKFSLSGNGRYVALESEPTNLVAGDTNGFRDIFVLDTQDGSVIRASVGAAGAQAVGGSSVNPSISSDGTKIAFQSSATNLAAGDTNGALDVFVHDRSTNTTVRVSVDSSNAQASGASSHPSISSDGLHVAFHSAATDLVASDTNGFADVFVRDLFAGTTVRASVHSSGAQATGGGSQIPSINSNGTKVAFESTATTLVTPETLGLSNVYVRDLSAGTTVLANVGLSAGFGNSYSASISSDGTRVAFESSASDLVVDDTNNSSDVFVRNLSTNTTVRASVNSSGIQTASNTPSQYPSISADGTRVAFHSSAANLVEGDTNTLNDIFVRDLLAGTTVRANLTSSGAQGTGGASYYPSISSDGTRVSFQSNDTFAQDENGLVDVFVRDLAAGTTTVPVTISGFGLE